MARDRLEEFTPTSGEEFSPARGKLWAMLLVFALMIPAGAIAAYCWWYEIEILDGRVLTAKAGIVGLIAAPLGVLLALVVAALLATAKQLVIGADCVQWSPADASRSISRTRMSPKPMPAARRGPVWLDLRLRDPEDPATLVPFWSKDRYEIQVLTYGKPVEEIHELLSERLAAFRTGGE